MAPASDRASEVGSNSTVSRGPPSNEVVRGADSRNAVVAFGSASTDQPLARLAVARRWHLCVERRSDPVTQVSGASAALGCPRIDELLQ
jgi:hypothetical protein